MWLPCCIFVNRKPMATIQQTPRPTGPNNITMTLRIERSVRQGIMVFALSGRMTAAEIAELKALFATDYRNLVLDLRDLSWQIATQ